MNSIKTRIIVLIVGAVVLISVSVSPLLLIGFEWVGHKVKTNNPHIDSNFSRWKQVVVKSSSGEYAFGIPQDWTISENENVYYIEDSEGHLWAFGTEFGTENDVFPSYKELIEKTTSSPLTQLLIEPFIEFEMMDGSDISRIVAKTENSSHVYYYAKLLKNAETRFVFIINAELSEDTSQYDIAEALVYSFAFKVDCSNKILETGKKGNGSLS